MQGDITTNAGKHIYIEPYRWCDQAKLTEFGTHDTKPYRVVSELIHDNGKYNGKGNDEHREGIQKHAQWNQEDQKNGNDG